jgi:DNA-directed RNA polymerase specialized sigma24 family protein
MQGSPSWVVIGDLVGSRRSTDRLRTHDRLVRVLGDVGDRLAGPGVLAPLQVTVGDEFQGTFTSLGAAVAATLRVRVGLLPDADARCGIGFGRVLVLQQQPRVEDGPGWWAARAAIERVALDADRSALHGLRTRYVAADGEPDATRPDGRPVPDPTVVNAALMLRDHLVSGLSPRSLSVLHGLLAGRTQKEIAQELGVTPSAVSQRVRSDGLAVLLGADELMGGLG